LVAVDRAGLFLEKLEAASGGILVPDEIIPQKRVWKNNPIRVHLYGMHRWRDIFSKRQTLAIAKLGNFVRQLPSQLSSDEYSDLSVAISVCLALAVDRQADYCSSLCTWVPSGEFIGHTFGRQAISMIWDFVEVVPFSDATGGFSGAVEWVANVLEREARAHSQVGHVECASATAHPLPNDSATAFVTDPPYYDAVPYSTLSNYFYVWLKRIIPPSLSHLFLETLTPNADECVVDEAKGKTHAFYEGKMTVAMAEGRRILNNTGIAVVVFAHKSTSGWEAVLQAIIDARWVLCHE
jgi:adenine-specific DNA methylase